MKKTIPQYIIDGSIRIESIEAFRGVLKEFPGRPELLKMYADLLAVCKRTYVAGQHYSEAAHVFLNAGRLFPAWVCKLLQWQLHRPSQEEFLEFHHTLGSTPHNGAPVDRFIKNLSPSERTALFAKFKRIYVPAQQTVLAAEEQRACIYFVVSGVLQEVTSETLDQLPRTQPEASRILWEADCFGDIYPFSEPAPTNFYVQTTTRVELITIPRSQLVRVCSRLPGVERGLLDLWHFRYGKNLARSPQEVRQEKSYRIAASMNFLSAAAG